MSPVAERIPPPGETSEARIAKALAHPLRARILERLAQRTASPGDIAKELNASLGVVSYHVRMLRDYDCVELVRTEPVRGALQHYYRATARPELGDGHMRALPATLRSELVGETVADTVDDLAAASEAGHLAEAFTGTARLELDERARRKLDRLLARTLEQALAIAAESRERGEAPGTQARGGEVRPMTLALLHFQRA